VMGPEYYELKLDCGSFRWEHAAMGPISRVRSENEQAKPRLRARFAAEPIASAGVEILPGESAPYERLQLALRARFSWEQSPRGDSPG